MDFVANFMKNTIAKKSLKSINICKSYERMYSGTVFIETRCMYVIRVETRNLFCVSMAKANVAKNR